MPVPKEVRERENLKRILESNALNYKVANIEGKMIFLQEAVWALNKKEPIPNGKLVCHVDGNPLNNNFDNLKLVDENKEHGDFHQESNKVFHEQNVEANKDFIKRNFDDIYQVLFPEKVSS